MRKFDPYELLSLLIVMGFLAFAWVRGWPQSAIVPHALTGLGALIAGWFLNLSDGGRTGRGAILLTAAAVFCLGFENGTTFVIVTFLSLAVFGGLARLIGRQRETYPVLPFMVFALVGMGLVYLPPKLGPG